MKITLNAKIITLFVIAGLLPFIITGVLSYQIAKKSLHDQSFNQLVSVRDIKKKQIEEYFEKIRLDISALSEDPTICNVRAAAHPVRILVYPCQTPARAFVGTRYTLKWTREAPQGIET